MHRELSLQARCQFLLSVILSTLDSAYCMQGSVKNCEKLQAVHRRAVRAACGALRDTPVDYLMDKLNVRCQLDSWTAGS